MKEPHQSVQYTVKEQPQQQQLQQQIYAVKDANSPNGQTLYTLKESYNSSNSNGNGNAPGILFFKHLI